MTRRRVGVFGGAFDPPHVTHVALAQAAMARWAELEPDSRGLLATRAIQAIRAAAIMTPITAKNTVIVLMYSWSCTIAAPTGSDSSSDPDGVRSQNVMK